tara:strand:+ start:3490 stop:3777 length:288 start_codon:yes stop_codon:yes gene_type:complete
MIIHHRAKVSKTKKERKKRKEKERIHTRAAVADQDEFKRWHFPPGVCCHVIVRFFDLSSGSVSPILLHDKQKRARNKKVLLISVVVVVTQEEHKQ